jgi:beta-mannosidase
VSDTAATAPTAVHTIVPLTEFEILGLAVGAGDPADLGSGHAPDVGSDAGLGWLPAAAPGGVHQALLAAGAIEHPFYGDNERKAAWVEEREWWYRARFADPRTPSAGGARVRLVFEGLDTVADVWLNGVGLGRHENQFRPAVFDVTDQLAATNTVLVRFSPPLAGRAVPPSVGQWRDRLIGLFASLVAVGAPADPAPDPGSTSAEPAGPAASEGSDDPAPGDPTPDGVGPDGASLLTTLPLATTLRKAACSWGWDFGPNLPALGLWRPAWLSVEPGPVIEGHQVGLSWLAADRSQARVRVLVETAAGLAREVDQSARVRLTSPSGRVTTLEIPLGAGRGEAEATIDDPELWWTHDLGEQPLHELEIALWVDGAEVDRIVDRVGLRTVEVDRSPDPEQGGRLFRFVLNGTPLFARGANWVPGSQLIGSVSRQTYQDRVRRARAGNLTMLRVWGGGVYEADAFYTACDEQGVLVWQDFAFACVDYPSADPKLQAEVTAEAEHQVRRLRNRACLALWCGNNECQIMHGSVWQSLAPGDWGWHFFHDILPQAVARHDPFAHYWPSSPYGEGADPVAAVNSIADGDRHTWEVWHGDVIPTGQQFPTKGDERHYRRYADDTAKFVSEFGLHAAPELATLRRWIPEEDLWLHSPTLDLHNKDNPKNKGDELLAVTTGLPSDLAEQIEFTQAVQAEGLAFAVEHYRRRQPHTAGALVWQFNDVWPGFSWSMVDYDGVPKASYYAVARASAPLAVSFREAGPAGPLELWLVNNGPSRAEVVVEVESGWLTSGRADGRFTVVAAAHPGQSVLAWSGPLARGADRYVWASSPVGAFPSVRHHFAEIGDLRFGPHRVEAEARPGALRLRSTGYCYGVRVSQPHPGIYLSDNWFDLRDGEERLITVEGADPAALAVTVFPGR